MVRLVMCSVMVRVGDVLSDGEGWYVLSDGEGS